MHRGAVLVVLVLAVLAAGPDAARAQDAAAEPSDAASPPTAGADASTAEDAPPPPDPRLVEAQDRVERGTALFDAGDYEAARAELLAAYELLDSHPQRYVVLLDLAQCEERLFRYDDAIAYYRRYLEDAPEDASERGTVRHALGLLDALLGTVVVAVDGAPASGLVVWANDHQVATAPGAIRVPGGRVRIDVRADGFVPATAEVEVVARREVRVSLTLVPVGSLSGLDPAIFTGLAVTAGALTLLGVGLVVGAAVWDGNERAMERVLRDEAVPGRIQGVVLASDVSFAAAASVGLAALVTLFLTDFDGAATVSPSVSPDEAGLTLRGIF
ncbi:MAG: tetratricopeptide repeat protein [Sandaracinus sp.]